jgi:hypothetical protein
MPNQTHFIIMKNEGKTNVSKTMTLPTGDRNNPWGMNSVPEGPFLFRGVEIPVIDENSSREDLLRYIRILEARLDLDHDYMRPPDHLPRDLKDIGAVLDYDLPEKERSRPLVLNLVRHSSNQAERVAKLARGTDRVGCLEIGVEYYKRGLPDDGEECPEETGSGDAGSDKAGDAEQAT